MPLVVYSEFLSGNWHECISVQPKTRKVERKLLRLSLLFLFRPIQPPIQYLLRWRRDFEKPNSGSHIRLRINDLRLGLEERISRGNLHQHHRPCRKGIHHVQIAAKPAQLAHARGDAHVGSLFDQLGTCDERVPWRTTFLSVFDGALPRIPLTTMVRRFAPISVHPPVTFLKLRRHRITSAPEATSGPLLDSERVRIDPAVCHFRACYFVK